MENGEKSGNFEIENEWQPETTSSDIYNRTP